MTLPKCRDCKHWTDQPYRVNVTIGGGEVRRCDKIIHFDEMDERDMAFVIDFEDYKAWLYTSAEFGCNHFESKDAS